MDCKETNYSLAVLIKTDVNVVTAVAKCKATSSQLAML